ncbi:hypothetical protein [Sandaracinus amylolyticus]|nr:hypothetical protein [Sandaracinus amylolyticus]
MRSGVPMHDAGSSPESGEVNLEAAVLDALEGVMSPATAMRVVLTALRYAERAALPRDPEAMSRFVIGPLREAVEECVGSVAYDAVSDRLSPLLLMASSGVRPRHRTWHEESGVVNVERARERETIRPPRGVDSMLVVTRDPAFVERMRAATTDTIEVAPVERAIDLVTRSQRAHASGLAAIAVVDALLPSVDLTTIAALATRPDAPFDVVLVGATGGQLRRIRYQIAASHRWVACEIEHAADIAVRELARARAAG